MEKADKYQCIQIKKQRICREDDTHRCLSEVTVNRCAATLPEGGKNRHFLHSDHQFHESGGFQRVCCQIKEQNSWHSPIDWIGHSQHFAREIGNQYGGFHEKNEDLQRKQETGGEESAPSHWWWVRKINALHRVCNFADSTDKNQELSKVNRLLNDRFENELGCKHGGTCVQSNSINKLTVWIR